MVKDVQHGKTTRKSFARIEEILEMPNLIEIQKKSYEWFLETGLREVFQDVSAITDYTGNLELTFLDYSLDEPKYSIEECKARDATYACPLKVRVRLRNKETGEIKEQEIFMGEFPRMTQSGTFIFNGAERAIVSQIVRSPGVYYGRELDKTDKPILSATVIPYRGAWLEYETDMNDVFYVRIDKNRKIPITSLIRALGVKTDAEILEMFGEDERILATLERDPSKTQDEALIEIYKKMRPGEPPSVESATNLMDAMFFDTRRYDISAVGRYKYNKKLNIARRLIGRKLLTPAVDPMTGEILADEGTILTREQAREIAARGVHAVTLESADGKAVKVFDNGMVDADDFKDYTGFTAEELGLKEKVRFSVLKEIIESGVTGEALKQTVADRIHDLIPKTIIVDDILATICYLIDIANGIGTTDDIDHLGNRRLRCVGELLQNQVRIGFSRMERVIRERMTIQDLDTVTPQSLINIRPVTAAIKEFFGSSPLSQFMDQNNPLAELTHKRRLSALGPGGLSRDRASMEVRDVHYSHYGRMCPIETPEGPNIGLISYLATYARINDFGFIEAPYRIIDKATGRVTDEVQY
ncbi:MAG: DNA-directed RNA polymerase subunit beta, partial [Butyricicoccus sp.]|nr:DNA-directed RNA polymerase subunit beta [Butyricicoccus sp.]